MLGKRTHLLIINYCYPPYKAIGSIRNYCFTQSLSKYILQTDLISTSNHQFFDKMNADASFISKKRYVFTLDYTTLKELLKKKSIQKKNKVTSTSNTISKTEKLINSFPINLFFYGGPFYIISGLFFALKYSQKNSIIYSSFIPYADHLIAYLVKKIKPQTYWIADFRDFQTPPNENKYYLPKFQYWVNKKIFSSADLITNVTSGITHYNAQFNTNSIQVSNGLPNHFIKENRATDTPKNTFNITYTGILYNGRRNASPILKAIYELIQEEKMNPSHLKINYAGRDAAIWETWVIENNLQNYSNILGEITHQDATQLQHNSCINIVMNWVEKNALGAVGGKFFEYLTSGVPILCLLSENKDAEIEEMNNTLQFGLVTYDFEKDCIEKMKTFILTNYHYWEIHKQHLPQLKTENLVAYTWPELIKPVLEKINSTEFNE